MLIWIRRVLDLIIMASSITLIIGFEHHNMIATVLIIISGVCAVSLLILTAIGANDGDRHVDCKKW